MAFGKESAWQCRGIPQWMPNHDSVAAVWEPDHRQATVSLRAHLPTEHAGEQLCALSEVPVQTVAVWVVSIEATGVRAVRHAAE